MSTTPTLHGDTGLQEQPGSPVTTYDVNKKTVTRIWEGPTSACTLDAVTSDSGWTGLGVRIVHVDITPMPGGKGRVVARGETGDSGQDSSPSDPIYENEWVEVDKPLLTNPIYWSSALGDPGDGTYALTLGDHAAIQAWDQETDFKLKYSFQWKVPQESSGAVAPPDGYTVSGTQAINFVTYNLYTLSTNAQNAAKKMLKGITTWTAYAPVVRETVATVALPTSNPCGKQEAPPSAGDPPEGYIFIRSAQRGTKTGRYGQWNQQREWQGAESVDTDLFPAPSS